MSARYKKVLYTILLFLPLAGFILLCVLVSGQNPLLVTVAVSVYLAFWSGLCYFLFKKIRPLNDCILKEDLKEKIINIPDKDFIESCEKRLINDGFNKRTDIYEDGEIVLEASCFYKITERSLYNEIDTVFFLEGIKAFSDLINTEDNLRKSFLNCLSEQRQFKRTGQVIAIVSPFPDREIYDFCVGSFYNQQNGILFLCCDRQVGKGYYSSLTRKINKGFLRSEDLVNKYIALK